MIHDLQRAVALGARGVELAVLAVRRGVDDRRVISGILHTEENASRLVGRVLPGLPEVSTVMAPCSLSRGSRTSGLNGHRARVRPLGQLDTPGAALRSPAAFIAAWLL